jgi:hypothetical protein
MEEGDIQRKQQSAGFFGCKDEVGARVITAGKA